MTLHSDAIRIDGAGARRLEFIVCCAQ
jgi:hypothetical protein